MSKKINHPPIKSAPPIGVMGPKKESEIPIKSCKFRRYIENENKSVPIINSLLIRAVFSNFIKRKFQ